jgi:iron complex transport system substrate-binding protein
MTITLDPRTSPLPQDPRDAGTRRDFLAGAATLAVLGLPACGDGEERSEASGTRTVTTDKGAVRVPAQPERIAVLSGGLAGYLYALGQPVVATDTQVLGVPPDKSGFPSTWSRHAREQRTKALPRGDLDLEAVAAARPDLIIGGGQGYTAMQASRSYDKLTAIAPTVVVDKELTSWQQQIAVIAQVVGAEDRAAELVRAFQRRRDEVAKAIALPSQPTAVLLATAAGKPFLVPPTAALPRLLTEVGFTMDDVVRKAGNPPLYGTGDSFEISAERLPDIADAPTLMMISLGGPSADQLARSRVYARLPAFRDDAVFALPASSYRPDYYDIMATLDRLLELFGR